MQAFFAILFALILIPALISGFAFSARYILRERSRAKRGDLIGDLVWSEIIYEGGARKMEGSFDSVEYGDLVGLVGLSESIKSSFPFRDRGIVSYVWSRAEDASVRFYIGVSEMHYGDGNKVRIAASSVGASAKRIDEPPFIPTNEMSIVLRGKSVPILSSGEVREGGSVAKAVSSVLEQLDKSIAASIVFTTEYMQESESRQLTGYITADTLAAGGSAMNFGGLGQQTQQMSNQPVRATIAASSSLEPRGRQSLSHSILTSAMSSISTLGWSHHVRPINTSTVGRIGIITGSVVGAFSLLFTIIQLFPLWFGGVMLALSAALVWFAATQVAERSIDIIRERLSLGEINVPSYVFYLFNPRWFFASRFLAFRYGGNSVDYKEASPSTKRVNYINPLALYEIASFPPAFSRAGVDVHNSNSLSRGIPQSLVDTHHPIYYGQSGSGQYISLDISDLHYSLYTAGSPNSGKTNFLQVIFAGVVKACKDRTAGMQITPIWAETKGEGAKDAWAIASKHPGAVFIEAHNPASRFRLALEGMRLSEGASVDDVLSNIDVLVSGMQFAWGDGIRGASREVLQNSLTIAMLLSPDEIVFLGIEKYIDQNKPNIMDAARILLGGDSSIDIGERILQMREEIMMSPNAQGERERALVDAITNLSRFFDPVLRKGTQAATILNPALNKISQLREARIMWTPDDRRLPAPVTRFPFLFAPIVLNMGPFEREDGNYDATVGPATARRLLLITNYILWNTIKANCSGWQAQGKRIPMFFDEVADVAVDSQNDDVANVIAEAGKEGRSRGASYFLGSQSPSQLPFQARSAALGSRTKFWFNMHEAGDLKVAIEQISSASESQDLYTTNDIHSLPNGTAVGVMQRGDRPTPPFTLRVPYAKEWAEVLLKDENSVADAIVEYYEAQARKQRGNAA